jgi:predicted nucleotidyltransferase
MVQIMTTNEVKALSYLCRHYKEKLSINQLAGKLKITPKGMLKILKKFEDDGIVIKEKIANASIYTLHFSGRKTEDLVKYALKCEQAPNTYVKMVEKDLLPLHDVTPLTILFGSVLTTGNKANDIDLLAVITKNDYSNFNQKVKDFEKISPKKIHPVIQTKDDLKKNLRKGDAVMKEVLHKGYILWGHGLFYEMIKNAEKL